MTGSPPYKDLSEDAVEKAYAREECPDLQSLDVFQDVIRNCWSRSYANAEALLMDIKTQGMLTHEFRYSNLTSLRSHQIR